MNIFLLPNLHAYVNSSQSEFQTSLYKSNYRTLKFSLFPIQTFLSLSLAPVYSLPVLSLILSTSLFHMLACTTEQSNQYGRGD